MDRVILGGPGGTDYAKSNSTRIDTILFIHCSYMVICILCLWQKLCSKKFVCKMYKFNIQL